MTRKRVLAVAIGILGLFAVLKVSSAGLIDYSARERRTGGAGPVSRPRPAPPVADTRPSWMKTEPKVTKKSEEAYDINRDGKLQTAEVKIFLRDTLAEIDKKGGVLVNSDILKEYDKSGDGIVSRYEAEALRKDVVR